MGLNDAKEDNNHEEASMGLANARIILRNPRLTELEPVEINALADTGAVHLCKSSSSWSRSIKRRSR